MKWKYEISSEDKNRIKECINSEEFIIELNNNIPYLTDNDEKQLEGNKKPFSDLDTLGRCQGAFVCITMENLSNEQNNRLNIKSKTTGLPPKEKNFINNKFIFQRCHLIGCQLFKNKEKDENANKINLFTGTRFMNHEMLYYENMIAEYVQETGNRVLYRVTPYFEGDNELVFGIRMEAKSINSKETRGLLFNIFVYNKQPCIKFNYKNGEICEEKSIKLSEKMLKTKCKYIINKKNKKFHINKCVSVYNIKSKDEVEEKGEELIQRNYCPCGICIPY